MGAVEYRPGLEGVIATETAISYLDVEHEEIVVRGYNLLDLARQRTYVDVVGLLVNGHLPDAAERAELERQLLAVASVPAELWQILRLLPREMDAMDRLRTAISALGGWDQAANSADPEQDRQSGFRVIAQSATIVANLLRVAEGGEPNLPDPRRSYPENFLWMITGREPSPAEVRAFDQTLIAYAEHELPNSTFAARVIALRCGTDRCGEGDSGAQAGERPARWVSATHTAVRDSGRTLVGRAMGARAQCQRSGLHARSWACDSEVQAPVSRVARRCTAFGRRERQRNWYSPRRIRQRTGPPRWSLQQRESVARSHGYRPRDATQARRGWAGGTVARRDRDGRGYRFVQ